MNTNQLETKNTIRKVETPEELNAAFDQGLVTLYQQVFADPPYEESFTPEDVKSFFELYYTRGVLLLCKENPESVIGFSASIPLVLEQEIATIAKKFGIDPETVWYFADLGVDGEHRRQGIASNLVNALIDETPVNTLVMRTSENNLASQKVNQSVGFQIIDGMEQYVDQKRQDGSMGTDRRIFLQMAKGQRS